MDGPPVLATLVVHASGPRPEETFDALRRLTYEELTFAVALVGEVGIDPEELLGPGRCRAVVRLPEGAGFGEAATAAVRAAGEGPVYVLLLHDDVAPDPDVVERLVERVEAAPDVAAAGVKLVRWDDPEVLQEVGGSVDRFGVRRTGLEVGEVDHGQHDETDDVLFCSAACLLVRGDALEEVGGLDPDAWPLYEDVDLCWRLRAAGHRVVVVPGARARHAALLSTGQRVGAGEGFGELGLRIVSERGRLRFMFKNYGALTLALVLPQYAVLASISVLSALVRREFWRLRYLVRAWGRVASELSGVREARRRVRETARVEDQELLRIGARRTVVDRRHERVALVDRATQALRTIERRGRRLSRDPVAWAGVGGAIVVAVTLRGVLFGGVFTLGELRPLPRFTDALGDYLARPGPEGLAPYAPTGPGLLVLGAIRSLVLGRAALAEKLVLLLPLIVAGFGAARLGRVLGLRGGASRWFPVLAAVNPVTFVLVREGFLGALVAWAGSMWVAARLLGGSGGPDATVDRLRSWSGWAVGWGIAAALHPPALVWFLALGAGIQFARRGDGGGRARLRLLAVGAFGAFLVGLPWSIGWLGPHTPLLGDLAGFLRASGGGLQAATFGAGWPLVALVVVAIGATVVVGGSGSSTAFIVLLALAWLSGAAGLFPAPTALVVVGWCALALLVIVARRVADELPTYELGWRHGVVIGVVAVLAASWGGSALGAMFDGTSPHRLEVVPSSREPTGRVLWLLPAGRGVLSWATEGFTEEMGAFPVPASSEEELALGALDAARAGRTHRLGSILALGDVSHVVALQPAARGGLAGQADLSVSEEQGRAVVYRNEAWLGRAMLLTAAPTDVLRPEGLARLVRSRTPLETETGPDGAVRLDVPEGADGVVYAAVGTGGGWRIGEAPTRGAAAGVWAPADEVEGAVTLDPPGGWGALLHVLAGAAFSALVLGWASSAYLAAPGSARAAVGEVRLRSGEIGWSAVALPVLAVAAAWWVAWPGPGAAAAEPPLLSSAWYCPPVGEGLTERLAVANPERSPMTLLVRPSLEAPAGRAGELAGHDRRTIEVDASRGSVVETFGRRAVVASLVEDEGRTDAALCAEHPRETVYFAEGGRGATRAVPRLFERYIVYNPFPELARVSIRFFSPDQSVSPPDFQDVRVEPGEAAVIDPESQFFFPLELSTEVDVWQGRAVVGRRLTTSEQVTWDLGTRLRESGVVPRAGTAGAVTDLIFLDPHDDPHDRAADVELDIVGQDGAIAAPPFEVPASRRLTFDLGGPAPEEPQPVVRVRASRPLGVETLVVPEDRDDLSLLPLLDPARTWAVPAAEGRRLLVTNPGTAAVEVDLVRLGSGSRLEGGEVGPSGVRAFEVPGDEPFGVLVEGEAPVVVVALGGGGALPGVPLR